MKKRYFYVCLFIVVLCAVGLPGISVEAKTLTGYSHEYADKSGRYIYYATPESSLKRYDTKTGKTKAIYSCKVYDPDMKRIALSNGFSYPTVRGNYIYVQWTKGVGSIATMIGPTCVYRISKDGKQAKKLALGAHPVLIGNRIYYDEVKKSYDEWGPCYKWTGRKMSMKLNGKDKRVERNTIKLKKRSFGKYQLKWKTYPNRNDLIDKNGKQYNEVLILTKPNGKKVKLAKWWCQ